MPVLNCCKSSQTKANPETKADIYFPAFPTPQTGTILFLDINGKRVIDKQTEIVNVVMPLWYWLMIVDYVEGTESAVQAYLMEQVIRCKAP